METSQSIKFIGKIEQWSIDSLTDDEKEYIDRYNLDISKLGINGKK